MCIGIYGAIVKDIVKFFHQTEGWGFVAPDDGSADLFVHCSASDKEDASAYLPAGC